MSNNKENETRKDIGNFYIENHSRGPSFTVKHFKKEKVPQSTIYSIIRRVDNNISLERQAGLRRKREKLTTSQKRSLCRVLDTKVGVSYRWLGNKMGRHHNTIKKDISEAGYERKKQKIAPEVTPKQKQTQKTRLNRLVKGSFKALNSLDVIMDNESYYPLSSPYLNHYYVKKGVDTSP